MNHELQQPLVCMATRHELIRFFLVFGLCTRIGGQALPAAYTPIVLTCMAVIVVSILVSAYYQRSDTAVEEARGVVEPFGFSDLLKDVLAVLGNRNYLFLLFGLFS